MEIHGIGFRRLRQYAKDEAGGVLIYVAVLAPVLFGSMALAVDVVSWQMHSNLARTLADSAAMAGALEIQRAAPVTYYETDYKTYVLAAIRADAEHNSVMLVDVVDGSPSSAESLVYNRLEVAVHYPPISGSEASNANAVEIIVQYRVPQFFAEIMDSRPIIVAARSVARRATFDKCMVALSDSGTGISVTGGSSATMPCGIMVNSLGSASLSESGGSLLQATTIETAGSYSGTGFNPTPLTGVSQIDDPLEHLPSPDWTGSCTNHPTITGNITISPNGPDAWCRLQIEGGAVVTFDPGIHVINGPLTVAGGSTIRGTDVTFFFPPTTDNKDDVNFGGGARIDLHAPTGGEYSGILFFGDPDTETGLLSHSFSGGVNQILDGILYFPGQHVTFSGGATTTDGEGSSPTMIVADSIAFTGGSVLGDPMENLAGASAVLASAALVE